jgi:hypothetical protein
MRVLSGIALFCATGVFAAATPDVFDAKTNAELSQQLRKDCGQQCVDMFDSFVQTAQSMPSKDGSKPKWTDALKTLMEGEYEKTLAFYHDDLAGSVSSTSFVQDHNKLTWTPFDTPCAGTGTCKAAEIMSSKCNYGRLATLATYQAVNLAVHVFGVLTNALCGCVHAGPASFCVLGSFQPTCGAISPLYGKLYGMSTQVWESAKGATKRCKMFGDFRISS